MANTPKTTSGAGTTVAPDNAEMREPVLDVVDRVSEMCFGLFMALTFVGAVASGTGGPNASRTMLHAALGCNLAWGLVDAVMFLVRTLAARGQKLSLALAVRNASDRSAAIGLMRDALPQKMRSLVTESELEAMRARLAGTPTLPARVDAIWPGLRPKLWEAQLLGDAMLVARAFVLGGEFWNKLRALFIRNARVVDDGEPAGGEPSPD